LERDAKLSLESGAENDTRPEKVNGSEVTFNYEETWKGEKSGTTRGVEF
jgi:hypothetical protein